MLRPVSCAPKSSVTLPVEAANIVENMDRSHGRAHIEVGVSYHHGGDSGRDSFKRSITLEGNLADDERAQLMQAANMCPVGRTLGLSADIRTNDNVSVGRGGKL